MNVRRWNKIQKWLKDYLVPIIGVFLLIILLFSLFSWWNEPEKIDPENMVWLSVVLGWSNSESYIKYPWDYKKKIEGDISLYKWEEVMVKEWNVSLSLDWLWDLKLDKLWELEYLENWDFALSSSDLWLNSISAVNINMKFATVKIWQNSHVSFSQNEMWSTVYLISWQAEIINLAWESTVLWSGQKITVSRLDANNKDIDLSINKESIDDYFKQSDWYILNKWESYLVVDDKIDWDKSWSWTINWTWSTESGLEVSSDASILNFSNLYDESNVSSNSISVSWNFSDEEITKISLNGKDAVINTELKTFKFDNVSVPNKENDLVFKVYDGANDLISKFIYTIYYAWWQTAGTTGVTSSTGWWSFKVQTYDVDWSQFTFTEPTTKDAYTTTEDFVTIRWKVLAEWISEVRVNDFTLSSFNWSTWRYHASTSNNNLSVWTNQYEVKYFDWAWKVVYTNYYTIILKDWSTVSSDTSNPTGIITE